ncbi:cation diffusion facilitator family transporter [candidate division GN15 bacterium]|nr:cation diffusion facilitator family transporter [candidate division GN15 bacterium]
MGTASSPTERIGDLNRPDDVRPGLRATWVGMIGNVLLIGTKLTAGFASGSQALIADGLHSASDLFTDFTTLLGLKWGRKGVDADHPYGHGRIETISSMIVGAVLIGIGAAIAYQAVVSIHEGTVLARPGPLALAAAVFSILIKEALYWYTRAIGKRLRSAVLMANAWHHRSDALSSVAVLIGVAATYVDEAWYLADSIAALVVTFVVLRMGGGLIWAALKELADTAPREDVVVRISTVAEAVEGVHDVHDLRARLSGSQVFVEAHIVVDPDLTVRQGHEIARNVRRRIHAEVDEVIHVIIHVDPDMPGEGDSSR